MLSALVILLVSLTIYNFALRAEYLSGEYKNPFRAYRSSAIKNFNEIEVNDVNMMHVMVRKGDYSIHTAVSNADSVRFTKVGNRLIINIDFTKNSKSDDPNLPHWNEVVIYCPQLTYVKTNNHNYSIPLKRMSLQENNDYNYNAAGTVTLRRFKLDSLCIEQKGGTVNIGKSEIAFLKSTTAAASRLNIADDVYIDKADMHINDFSTLRLEKFNIPKFNYTLADSATITFTSKGATLKDLINKL